MKDRFFRDWWDAKYRVPSGSYSPKEEQVYDGWSAGWDAATAQAELEIKHLKAQLLRANTNEGAYKAAYLAGQMSIQEKKYD